MNPLLAFTITLGISIATLLLGGTGLIDRLSARKHWDEQIKECQTSINGTDDEHIRAALRRKSHQFSKAVTLDKCVPGSPTAPIHMTVGYTGLLILTVVQFPLFRLPGWVYMTAAPCVIASTLILINGATTYQIRAIEQAVYAELGYPETFHRLPTTPLRFRFMRNPKHVTKRRLYELNPQPQPHPA